MIPPVSRQIVRDVFLLTLGACLYTLAFPPYEWSGFAWLTLTPLFLVLRGKTPAAGFFAGLLFGTLSALGIVFWVYSAVATFFALGFVLDALGALFTYAFFGGLPIGLAAALSCKLIGGSHTVGQGRSNGIRCWLGVPAVWVCLEYARSSLLPGFSWGILGYSQVHHLRLIQMADLTGVYGLSFLIALSGYLTADLFCSLRLSPASRLLPRTSRAGPWPGLVILATSSACALNSSTSGRAGGWFMNRPRRSKLDFIHSRRLKTCCFRWLFLNHEVFSMSQSENGKHENTENTQIPGIFARSTHSKWIKSS